MRGTNNKVSKKYSTIVLWLTNRKTNRWDCHISDKGKNKMKGGSRSHVCTTKVRTQKLQRKREKLNERGDDGWWTPSPKS